jgi:hypothetical protein
MREVGDRAGEVAGNFKSAVDKSVKDQPMATLQWPRQSVSFSVLSGSRKCRKERAVFAGLMNQAKAAVSGLVLKYVARASVAIPFVIALGFALAATAAMLVQYFGHVAGYWIMAGGLAAIGVLAAVVVSVKEHEEEVAEEKAEQADTQAVVSDATAHAITQAPIALLGSLFAAPGGATAALKVAKVLGRNFPLVLLLVMIGALFWPTEEGGLTDDDLADARKPNGSEEMPSTLRH